MNSPRIKKFILEQQNLFWYMDKTKLEDMPHEILVEFILNYGDSSSVKKLFELLGLNQVAEIFYSQVAPGRRINYFPRTVHFFDLYFKRNAQGNFKSRPVGTPAFGQKIQ